MDTKIKGKIRSPKGAIVPAPDATVVTAPVEPVVTGPRQLTVADIIADVPAGWREPVYLTPFATVIRSVAGMPSATRDERAAVRDAIIARLDAAMPGHPIPPGKHTGRWTGSPVFEAQNAIYLACVMANVVVPEGVVMAMWRAELPNAKCDYLARNYAWSTLSEFGAMGRHGGVIVDGHRAAVVAWAKRGRKPIDA